MKFFSIVILSILSFTFLNSVVLAGEPLVNYNFLYLTDPVTKIRIPDNNPRAINGDTGIQSFRIPGKTGVPGKAITSVIIDPNTPKIGDTNDCYPDDPNNPKGNIVLSGRLISNFTNQPINGAVVAIYMGAEQLSNKPDPNSFGHENDEFIHGGKDINGRLTNLYSYDISKDGSFTVYACNDYKELSSERITTLKQTSPFWFSEKTNGPCGLEGYTGNSGGCTHFDYVKAYPKFSLAVVCGLYQSSDFSAPSPQIGEILSIDNYNDPYKSVNPPSFMFKNNFDIRINCEDNIAPFPVPFRLDYDAPSNVSSCRLDTISPNLRNYFLKVKEPIKNDFYDLKYFTIPGSTAIPDDSGLSCSNPDDIFCLKNFLTKSFPKPENGKNVFDYGNKNFIDLDTVNPNLANKSFKYDTRKLPIVADLTYNNSNDDYIAKTNSSSERQIDAKVDLKSSISDYKFDLNVLKDLYGCFTTFNSPALRSSAFNDEENIRTASSDIISEYKANNLRIPTCRELYCGTEFVPDNDICKVPKPIVQATEKFGFDYTKSSNLDDFYQINALSGYGPGVTLSINSLEEITNDFMVLAKELINSEFNPKKPIPGADLKYKPVSKISDIVACLDDDYRPVFLNDDTTGTAKEGSITYKYSETQEVTFFSPVPLLSFISVPYTMELFHSIEGDNYANFNKANPDNSLVFPEQCNPGKPFAFGDSTKYPAEYNRYDQQFANCRRAVIPGGVYSVSALNVISKYCTDAFKIPTPDAANLPKGSPISSVKLDSRYSLTSFRNSLEVDLSITKIGTPLSMCLCSIDDDSCTFNERLNSSLSTDDFAISSFVGPANQLYNNGESVNSIGFKCEAKFLGPIPLDGGRRESTNCISEGENILADGESNIQNVDEWVIPNKPENNFLGTSNNISVNWKVSLADIQSIGNARKYLYFTWGGSDKTYQDFKLYRRDSSSSLNWYGTTIDPDKDDDDNVGSIRCETGDRDPVTGKVICTSPEEVPKIGITVGKAEHISDEYIDKALPKDDSAVQISTFLNREAVGEDPLVKGELKILQDGLEPANAGTVQTKYQFRNAKYDPIPDLIEGFRRYSVMGFMGGDYCKAPKMGAVVDIQVNLLNTASLPAVKLIDDFALENHTAGIHCNTAIPEELKRCDDDENILTSWREEAWLAGRSANEQCRVVRCLNFCFQMTGVQEAVYRLEKDGSTDRLDIFCKNPMPTKGLEFQVNNNDEGCILESVSRIKQAYANPAFVSSFYKSVIGDERYDKKFYPIYNNTVCNNPALNNPDNPSYRFDAENCSRNVFEASESTRKFLNQGDIRLPITIP